MAGYYGLAAGEKVTKLCFVFRSADKTKEGKDTGGADIFVPVYKAGLNVTFTNPTANQAVAVGTVVNFNIASSVAANLNLLINNTSVKQHHLQQHSLTAIHSAIRAIILLLLRQRSILKSFTIH